LRVPERQKNVPAPWLVPVAAEDVPDDGRYFDLVADAQTRAAVARIAGLRDLPRLQANFDVTRHGGGLRVAGRVSATIGQTCVVTLEPLASEIDEEAVVVFTPQTIAKRQAGESGATKETADETEPLIDGTIDLGVLATEFLILGLDPYPRKPDAVFQPPPDATAEEGPFAPLAALKKDGQEGSQ
jgi:hypothetical protein